MIFVPMMLDVNSQSPTGAAARSMLFCLAAIAALLAGAVRPDDQRLHAAQSGRGAAGPPVTVEQVLAKYRAAAGGGEAINTVDTLVAEATAYQRSPFPHEARFAIRYSAPVSYQVIQTVPASAALGPRVFTLSGSASWYRGVQGLGAPLTSRSSLSSAESQTIQVRRWILESLLGVIPTKLVEVGTVKFADAHRTSDRGQEVIALSVSDDGGEFATLFFSTDTGLPVKATFRMFMTLRAPEQSERTIRFDDYRRPGTVLLPFSISRENGSHRILVSSYAVNPRLPPGLYRQPFSDEDLKRIVEYRVPVGR